MKDNSEKVANTYTPATSFLEVLWNDVRFDQKKD